ncbi:MULTISPECIES: response regulator [Nostoc]|uniref:response regulator n=1 Tax=Nostoc TaxID=1177 RepID=UPI0028C39A7A|nr:MULTISPECIES: response regulator [Nostoc]
MWNLLTNAIKFTHFIASLLGSGKYKSSSEVVRQGLRLLQQQILSTSKPGKEASSQEQCLIKDRQLDPFPGSGEMRERIRNFDWASTSVGSIETWPQSLKSTIRTLLRSRYPMILLWGEDLIQIYNDAYTSLIGAKHPLALGHSIRETQSESWDVIGPMITEVMTKGVPNWVEDQMLVVNRADYNEEAHFSLSYSAVEDDEGVIKGMLCVCSEVTQQVLGERRLRLQRDLAARASDTRSVDTTCKDILSTIAEYSLYVPFALIYLGESDGKTVRLFGSVHVEESDRIAPTTVLVQEFKGIWPFAQVMAGQTILVENLNGHITIAGGPWGEIVDRALALPIPSSNITAPLGVVIVGISPNRALDEAYKSFYELLAGQVSVSLRNAGAYEEERKKAQALAELDRAKTTFFNTVSHEFRTPLTLMLGPNSNVSHGAESMSAKAKNQVLLNGLQILVVDDEADGRDLVSFILQQHGALMIQAASLAQAWSVLERKMPHILISDLGMPEEDGYSFIRQIRALPVDKGGRIPAIALSAYAKEEDRRQALLTGFQMYLSKPFDPDELLIMVASLAGIFQH